MSGLIFSWAKQFGTSSDDSAVAITVLLNGDVCVCGTTFGNLAPGGSNDGAEDVFITKFDSRGNLAWKKQLGAKGRDIANGIASDKDGNIFICGTTTELVSSQKQGSYDYFVAKYSSEGDKLWVRQSGSQSLDISSAIAVDPNGYVIVGGHTHGIMAAGEEKGNWDAFFAKYDTEGNRLWVKQFGTYQEDYINKLTVDPSGNIFICGETRGDMKGGNNHFGFKDSDAFLAKLDPEGNTIWAKQLGTRKNEGAGGIAVDINGNVYVSGYTEGNFISRNIGGSDLFLAKYTGVGDMLWEGQLGSTSNDSVNDIAVTPWGEVYVFGYVFDPEGNDSASDRTRAILARYDTNGKFIKYRLLGSGGRTEGIGLDTDQEGNVFLSGSTYGKVGTGGKSGRRDAFIAKFLHPSMTNRLLSCTMKLADSTFYSTTGIKIKIWGEEGTTDWMDYSVSLQSEVTFSVELPKKIGKILACGFEIDKIDGDWPTSQVKLEFISLAENSSSEVALFTANRVLSKIKGFRLYLAPEGPLHRPADIEQPENATHLLDKDFFLAHWMIAHSKKEQDVLQSFLNSNQSKIVGVNWGKAFQVPETDSDLLKDAINEYEVTDTNDQAVWDMLESRLKNHVNSRSFLLDLMDERMLPFLEDLRKKMKAELNLVKGEFALMNMPEDTVEEGSSANATMATAFGGAAAAASLFAAIPFPPLQIGATVFAAVFSMASVIASATDPGNENVSGNDFKDAISDSLNLLTLKGADISLNYYHLFLNFEAARRSIRKIALHSMSLLESYALLEAGFKSAGIPGLPEKYAPRHIGLRPLLKQAYDDLLTSRGFLLGEELEVHNSPYDKQQSQSTWYSGVTGRLEKDAVGLSRQFVGLTTVNRWTCHQWRLMKDPVNSPSTFSEKALKRIQWLYPDGKDILKLLPKKRYVQPALCQVIENDKDKGWKYYTHQTRVSYWRPSWMGSFFLQEDFLEPADKPLLQISSGEGVTKQTKDGPYYYWWTPSWNNNVFIWFNWVVGELDDWVVFKWKLDWEGSDADPTSDKVDYKEPMFYQKSL